LPCAAHARHMVRHLRVSPTCRAFARLRLAARRPTFRRPLRGTVHWRAVFSHRSAFDRAPNALALALSAARARGARIVDLTESNPTAAGFTAPPAVLAALADPRGARYEPQPLGHS